MQVPGFERDFAQSGRRYSRKFRLALYSIVVTIALAVPILAMLALGVTQGYAVTQQKLQTATAELLRRVDKNLAEARQSIGEAERRGAGRRLQLYRRDRPYRGQHAGLFQLQLRSLSARPGRGRHHDRRQPLVVDLVTGKCLGAEALIRWRRRDGRMIGPADFIPAAERHGLISAVTARVLDLVAADAPAFLRHSPKAHIAINLSAFDLQDAGILARLDALTATLQASSDNIFVEATEHSFLAPERALPNVKSIRSSGFRIAIGDFGTGASSLSMIRVYELDYLKIDRSFLADIHDGESTPVLFHIAGLAHSLGLQIIAEGVETEGQRHALIRLGVQYAQGWLFGKPMSMPALCDFARQREVAAA